KTSSANTASTTRTPAPPRSRSRYSRDYQAAHDHLRMHARTSSPTRSAGYGLQTPAVAELPEQRGRQPLPDTHSQAWLRR
ncbi:hypothetical protein GBAR_LOCUS7358, partial [Geodia barretti]